MFDGAQSAQSGEANAQRPTPNGEARTKSKRPTLNVQRPTSNVQRCGKRKAIRAATDAKPRKRHDFRHPKDGLYAAKQRPRFQARKRGTLGQRVSGGT